jgi:hypothetical protein
MKNFDETNEFQVEKLEERLEMASWGEPNLGLVENGF